MVMTAFTKGTTHYLGDIVISLVFLHVYTATVYVCTGMLIYNYNTWFDYLCICMLQLNIGI